MNLSGAELASRAMELAMAGDFAAAERQLREAIAGSPSIVAYQINLGGLLARQGKLREAISVLQHAATLDPNSADGKINLGNALASSRRFAEAAVAYRAALRLRPGVAAVQRALAAALQGAGDTVGAIDAYRAYLQLTPGDGGAWVELARVLRIAGDNAGTIAALQKSVEVQRDKVEAYRGLSFLLSEAGRLEEAVDVCRAAAVQFPQSAEVQHDLGVALHKVHRWEDAISAHRSALALKPDYVEAHVSLGAALYRLGEIEAAKDAYRRALELRPGYPYALKNLGAALLLEGDFENGWAAFEARYAIEPVDIAKTTSKPMWGEEELGGQRILLVLEQGLGDVIQFIRYVPMVQQRGGRVSVVCWQGLKRLFTGQLGIEQVVGENETPPEFDLYCPLGMLPKIFGTNLQTIPSQTPYLQADPVLISQWHERIGLTKSLRVGLVWAGNPAHLNDSLRSISLSDLAPLHDMDGVKFYSLQKGPRAADVASAPIPLVDLSSDIHDMADTAAAIANLDLVITVDTSVAHLAGALGKPVWVMVQFMPDWRWMLGRGDSPWYPTMRLFRQTRYGDWKATVGQVDEALKLLTNA